MRAKRTDTTQVAIVDALRGAGCKVWIVSGTVDLVVWSPKLETVHRSGSIRAPWEAGALVLIDCKTNANKRHGVRFDKTEAQKAMEREGWPLRYATTPEAALRACGFRTLQ